MRILHEPVLWNCLSTKGSVAEDELQILQLWSATWLLTALADHQAFDRALPAFDILWRELLLWLHFVTLLAQHLRALSTALEASLSTAKATCVLSVSNDVAPKRMQVSLSAEMTQRLAYFGSG